MRVLHVLGELRASGAEVMLLNAVSLLRAFEIEPVILSTGKELGSFAKDYLKAGVELHHLPFERKLRYLGAFRRLTRESKIDLVHVHTERANFVLGISALSSGAAVVRTIHSVFAYEGRLRLVRSLERRLLRIAGVRQVSIGASVEDNERQRLKNATIRVDNWIGPNFNPASHEQRVDSRKEYGIGDDRTVISSIGNCSDVKNHESVLWALETVTRATDRPFVYLHAGYGPAESRERQLAARLPAERVEVRFLGTVRNVRSVLWASDIYCMPSLYEGMSISALEALACGVPAVLSCVPGLVDVAEPSHAVRFVEPTPSGVAEGILQILRALDAAKAAAAKLASQVNAERSIETSVEKLVAIYRSV